MGVGYIPSAMASSKLIKTLTSAWRTTLAGARAWFAPPAGIIPPSTEAPKGPKRVNAAGKQFRHGDVIIQQVAALPEAPEPLPHLILAHGELTGHAHRVTPASGAKLYRSAQGVFLEIHAVGQKLVHEEHASIELPPGVYRVWRQREYSPEEIRIVRD